MECYKFSKFAPVSELKVKLFTSAMMCKFQAFTHFRVADFKEFTVYASLKKK